MKVLLIIALAVSCGVFLLLQMGNKPPQPASPGHQIMPGSNDRQHTGIRMDRRHSSLDKLETFRPEGQAQRKVVGNKHSIDVEDIKARRELSADTRGKIASID